MPPRGQPRPRDDRDLEVSYYTNPRDFTYRRGDEIPFSSPEDYQHWSRGESYAVMNYGHPPRQPRYEPPPAQDQLYRSQPPSSTPSRGMTPPHMRPYYPDPSPAQRSFSSVIGEPSRRASPPRRSPSYTNMNHPNTSHSDFYEALCANDRHGKSPPAVSKEPSAYTPSLPPAAYLELSNPVNLPSIKSDQIIPKLLVLDLNGALIYRSKGGAGKRSVYPRPYLCNFLEYLFGPATSAKAQEGEGGSLRPWEVFVWSSAQPHNVQNMVEKGFGQKWIQGVYEPEPADAKHERLEKGEGRLLGVWARDRMDLSDGDYRRKVQTFKDLRKVVAHFAEPGLSSGRPPMVYDEKTVLLLDDSPLKAVNQPWNQLVVPEYDSAEWHEAKQAVTSGNMEGEKIDRFLLAVIGILEELKTAENVPAWFRSGGLMAGKVGDDVKEDINVAVRRLSCDPESEVTLKDLPSHESFVHWHSVPEVVAHWVKKGIATLNSRGIELDHGMDGHGRNKYDDYSAMMSPSPRLFARDQSVGRAASVESEFDPAEFSLRRRTRAWTPSAPAMGEEEDPTSERSRHAIEIPCSSRSATDGSSRRQMHTAARDIRPIEAELFSGDNLSEPIVAGPAGNLVSDEQRADEAYFRAAGYRIDSWRTFKAAEVSAYLFDVADRIPLDPSNQQDLQNFRHAAQFLSTFAPEPEPIEHTGLWSERMCLGCTLREGEAEGRRMKKDMHFLESGRPGTKQDDANGKKITRTAAWKQNSKKKSDFKQPKKKKAKSGPRTEVQGAKAQPDGWISQVSSSTSKPSAMISLTEKDVKKHTGGWKPTPAQIDTVLSKFDAQSARERGVPAPKRGKSGLPMEKPEDVSDSMWRSYRSVLRDTGVALETKAKKAKQWDNVKRRSLVHLAMYRDAHGGFLDYENEA